MSMFTEGRIKSIKIEESPNKGLKCNVSFTIDPTVPFAFEYKGEKYILFATGEINGDDITLQGKSIKCTSKSITFKVNNVQLAMLIANAQISKTKCRFWINDTTDPIVSTIELN